MNDKALVRRLPDCGEATKEAAARNSRGNAALSHGRSVEIFALSML
jgi:hypothetical protein